MIKSFHAPPLNATISPVHSGKGNVNYPMITASLADLAKQLDIPAPTQHISFHGISSDTRTLKPGNLFIAICGEQFDGHNFVAEAEKKGACAAIVSRKIADVSIPQLVVKDTILALGKIAANWRERYPIPLIGVTCSNGKTTLKNMLASIMRAACADETQVLATEGNLNNTIGLPFMLLRLNEQHRLGVIEMGMNQFGEIGYLSQLTKPQVAVITNAAESHLAGVGDVAGVARAKGEIFQGLDSNGIAILNKDDAHFATWQKLIAGKKHVTFGMKNAADVTAKSIRNQQLSIQTPKGVIDVDLPLLGKHNMMNALAATAAALALNIELTAIKKGLETVKPAPHRMNILKKNGALIIDDTYNANPFSLRAGVDTLAAFSGKKIVVLGDMRELGPTATELHFAAGEHIKAAGIQQLFTLGELSAETARAFGSTAEHFVDREKLVAAVKNYLAPDTTILVKGSRSMQMDLIVNQITDTQPEHSH